MRLTLEDAKTANRIIHHPKVYGYITDDYAVYCDPKEGRVGTYFLKQDACYVLSPCKGFIAIFIPQNQTTYEIHVAALPQARGSNIIEPSKLGLQWMFDNTNCEKVVASIPFDSKYVKIFALRMGFHEEGVMTKSIKRNGVLLDQWRMGMEKETFICHQ